MDLSFTAKIISDLALWYGTAGFVLSFYGAGLSLLPMLIIVLVSASSAFLYKKKRVYRYIPLPLLLLSLQWARSFTGLLLTIPPLLYCAWICHDARFSPDYEKSIVYFKAAALAMLVFCFFALLGYAASAGIILRYLLIFLFSGVFMLRLLRHDEQNRREPRLQLINLTLLLLLSAAALFLSSDFFLTTAQKTLSLVYQKLIAPLLLLITYIFLTIFMLFIKLLGFLKIGRPEQQQEIQLPNVAEMLNLDPNFQGAKSELLAGVLTVLGIAAFLALAFIIFRRIAAGKSVQENIAAASHNTSLQPEEHPSILSALAPRTPREIVRLYYKRFLKNVCKKGIRLSPGYTSERIEQLCSVAYDPVLLSEMRGIYIAARYSPNSVTKEDAAQMKKVCSKLVRANNQSKRM